MLACLRESQTSQRRYLLLVALEVLKKVAVEWSFEMLPQSNLEGRPAAAAAAALMMIATTGRLWQLCEAV